MAGRNPKPKGEKARSGRQRITFESLNPADGTPRPPSHLDGDGVYAWVTACKSLIPLRFVSHIDLIALEMFASAFSRWRRCERACKRSGGEYAKTPNGHMQLSAPRINANRALGQVMLIGGKLGMTPVERIKTTESAQGDLPFDEPADSSDAETETEIDGAMSSIFSARQVRLVSDNTGGSGD